ncbi:MAG: TonB-dependent receptor [Tannerellaceae bacterium]|jgi:TonB-linked SusC/RagA family outer membrane protein|nr:TonB-dependent receptor [Tannerellaceae bacterium]
MKKRVGFIWVLALWIAGVQALSAQQTSLTGIVLGEEDGEPIIGASVVVKGASTGTITDIDGRFALDAPKGATLIISYVGMKPIEIKPLDNKPLRLIMSVDARALDEVIVVAYGTAKKSSFTGSATAVGAQILEKRVLSNVTSALEGSVSGLQVTSGMGQPGSTPSFRIRGFGSINSSTTPLIILDGAVFDGNLADINPNDIESMTVLKDAASTSLYGASAGNGVILVTSKSGKGDSGSHSVNLSISQGFSQRGIPEYDRLDVFQYYPAQWQMLRNKYQYGSSALSALEANQKASDNIASTLIYNPFKGIDPKEIVSVDGLLNPNATQLLYGDDLDWEGEFFGTGHIQDYNLSFTSKSDKSDAFASVNYQDNKGYALATGMERFTGRVNYNIYPVKWFKAGLNISAAHSISQNTTADDSGNSTAYNNFFQFSRLMAPIYPIHKHDDITGEYILDATGQKIYDYESARLTHTGRDALVETLWNERGYERDQYNGRTFAEFTFLPGLKLNLSANLEGRNQHYRTYENIFVGDGKGSGRMDIEHRRYRTHQFNQLLTYQTALNNHHLDLLAGHESYGYRYEYLHGTRQGESIAGLHEFGNFVTINTLSSFTDSYKKEGYLFRANYDFDDRYYASLSYRHDGSSRFYKDNRWGDFWSAGLSWRLDQEDFLSSAEWVDNLKFRASYGETGNDKLLNSSGGNIYYAWQTLFNLTSSADESGVYFDSFGNKDLQWETVVSSDAAVEFGLFGRLSGSIEYYNRYSRSLLFSVPTPTSTGVADIYKNMGRIDNYGVEINLEGDVYKTPEWRVNLGANASTITNRIKSLPPETPTIVSGTKRYEVGHSRYDFWLRQYVGVDPETGNALYLFDAENQIEDATVFEKDGKQVTTTLTKALYAYSGSTIPKVYGGFHATVDYKEFELSAIFSYQLGGKMLDGGYQALMSVTEYGYAMHTDVLKAWKQPGDITDVPRLDDSRGSNFDGTSTRWLISSDYLNVKSITLSYGLPKKFLRPIGFKSLRLSVSAENLWQFNARKGLNAAAEFNGIVYNAYLPARTLTASLNLSF